MTNDVSRAYFYAPIQEGQHMYVKLPEEDILPGEEKMCGKGYHATPFFSHQLSGIKY